MCCHARTLNINHDALLNDCGVTRTHAASIVPCNLSLIVHLGPMCSPACAQFAFGFVVQLLVTLARSGVHMRHCSVPVGPQLLSVFASMSAFLKVWLAWDGSASAG